MEFREDELIDREIEIAGLLVRDVSMRQIAETTGLSKKLLTAHLQNMMQKLKAGNGEELTKALKERFRKRQ